MLRQPYKPASKKPALRTLSAANPFGHNRYGYLWERVRREQAARHLDYGAYDGAVLTRLVDSGVVMAGTGVDANALIVSRSQQQVPPQVTLTHIDPGTRLPFEADSFDSASVLDVLEHVCDQNGLLRDVWRVLRTDGLLVVTVPRKHAFSCLDTGNFKFVFPRLHRALFSVAKGKAAYRERYVQCADGLFGDIEVGKARHEHFTLASLTKLLSQSGFLIEDIDGAGLFARLLVLLRFVGRAPVRRLTDGLMEADARRFSSTHLFCSARKNSGSVRVTRVHGDARSMRDDPGNTR